jgi:hypothetical protein
MISRLHTIMLLLLQPCLRTIPLIAGKVHKILLLGLVLLDSKRLPSDKQDEDIIQYKMNILLPTCLWPQTSITALLGYGEHLSSGCIFLFNGAITSVRFDPPDFHHTSPAQRPDHASEWDSCKAHGTAPFLNMQPASFAIPS